MTKTGYVISTVITFLLLFVLLNSILDTKSAKESFIRVETYKVIDKSDKDKSGEYTIKCEDIDGQIVKLKLGNITENKKIDIEQFYKVIKKGKIYDFQIINYKRKIGMNNHLYIIGFGETEGFEENTTGKKE